MTDLPRTSLPILVLLLAGIPHLAWAQVPAPSAIGTSNFVPLTAEKQDRIRAFVRAQEIATTPAAADVSAGATLPVSVPLRGLPRDMVTEVSKVTSYRYVVLDNTIAIVEPNTRRVVQVIKR